MVNRLVFKRFSCKLLEARARVELAYKGFADLLISHCKHMKLNNIESKNIAHGPLLVHHDCAGGTAINAETTEIRKEREKGEAARELRYRVYSGSERLDLGDKRIACLCSSESQAKHMARFWGEFGYYEADPNPRDAA